MVTFRFAPHIFRLSVSILKAEQLGTCSASGGERIRLFAATATRETPILACHLTCVAFAGRYMGIFC